MLSCPLTYSPLDTRDFSQSRGANQGEWIICKDSPDVQYIAGKDAGPCVLIFMHGSCAFDLFNVAAVAHISVAEDIASLSKMCIAMQERCAQVQISMISGASTENTDLAKQIAENLNNYFPGNFIHTDLGRGTSKVVLEIKTGVLWKQKDIPLENYAPFDPNVYFQKAVVGIFDKDKKSALKKTYDNISTVTVSQNREIVVYKPWNAPFFINYLYMIRLLAEYPPNQYIQGNDDCDKSFKGRLT